MPLPSDRHRKAPPDPDAPRVTGRVRWFDQIHGVGLVKVPGRGEAHVYYKEILDEGYRALEAGDTISFRVDATDRGLVARDVRHEGSLPRE